MRRVGIMGKHTPLNQATHPQREAIKNLDVEAVSEGAFLFEVRYPTWIGTGCAADRKAITVCVDGKIRANVETDGTLT